MSSDGVYLARCPSRHCAVYFLIGTPDLLNDPQVQVVVRRDPADATFAVDAQQGAVLGPLVAGRVWSYCRQPAAATGDLRGTHLVSPSLSRRKAHHGVGFRPVQ